MKFADRIEAGRKLGEELEKYKGTNAILMAIPRGGVPIAYEIAQHTGLPMQLLLVKKIGHPHNREYAIGAVGLDDSYIFPTAGAPRQYVLQETNAIRQKLIATQNAFPAFAVIPDLSDKTVIIVDDGIATGNTALAAVQMLRRRQPAHIVVATPVISPHAAAKLGKVADEIITLYVPKDFYGVGSHYVDFRQVTEQEVKEYLGSLQRQATEPA
jgi:predicted phosphoribosyltransferase